MRLEIALQLQPSNDRSKVERGTPPGLPRMPSLFQPEELLHFDEARAGIVGNPSSRRTACAAAKRFGFEQRHLDAGGGEGVGGHAASQPAAHNGGVSFQRAAMSWITGDPGFRELIDPGRTGVASRHLPRILLRGDERT